MSPSRTGLIASLAIALLGPLAAHAVTCIDYSLQPRRGAEITLSGRPRAIDLIGDLAFIAAEQAGIHVVDIGQDPPVLERTLPFPDSVYDVVIVGTLAYVGAEDTFYVLDLTDPINPVVVGFLPDERAWDISVDGDLVCYSMRWDGLRFVDISDPSSPQMLGWIDTDDGAEAVHLVDGWAYVADKWAGFLTVDASDPTSPQIGATLSVPQAEDVVVAGGHAYVADGGSSATNLRVMDIADPGNPAEVALRFGISGGRGLDIQGSFAFASGPGGFSVWDISVPDAPVEVGSASTAESRQLAVDGNRAYLVEPTYGTLQVVELDYLESPEPVAEIDAPSGFRSAGIEGDMLYASPDGGGLDLYYVTTAGTPVQTGHADASRMGELAASGSQLAGINRQQDSFLLFDVTNITAPALVGSLAVDDPQAVAFEASYAYVGSGGLVVIDCSEPAQPEEVATHEGFPWGVNDIVIEGDVAYLSSLFCSTDCSYGYMYLVDTSVPTQPVTLGELDFQTRSTGRRPTAIAVAGNHAYLAVTTEIAIVDVTDPTQPFIAGTFDPPRTVLDVWAQDGMLYVVTSSAMEVFDLADPLAPQYLGDLSILSPRGVSAGSDLVLTWGSNGITLAAPQCSASPTAVIPQAASAGPDLRVHPNPAAGAVQIRFQLPRAVPGRIGVYDVAGRRIGVVFEGRLAAGAHALRWDGRVAGRPAAAGVYFVRAELGGRVSSRKVIRVR